MRLRWSSPPGEIASALRGFKWWSKQDGRFGWGLESFPQMAFELRGVAAGFDSLA